MASYTKKIRLLQEYIDKGWKDRIVLLIKDEWDFDPDKLYNPADREFFSVEDVLEQFKNKAGVVYNNWVTASDFKELCKAIEKDEPIVKEGFYQDSYVRFHEKYPNYEENKRQKAKRYLTYLNEMSMSLNANEVTNSLFALGTIITEDVNFE